MARKPKKNQAQEPDFLSSAASNRGDEDLLQVNLATPDAMLHQKSAKTRRRLVWVVIVACGLGSIATLNVILNPPVQEIVESQVKSMDVNSSIGKNAAYDSLTRWLNSDPSPLPGGVVLSWDGFENIKGGKAKNESDRPADPKELHTFTLAVRTDQETLFYTASVLVSVDKVRGGVTAALPSLLPRMGASSEGWSTELWAGYENTPVPEAVSESVAAWAKAFTGTSVELRLYVGDKDATHAYLPLRGARVLSTQVSNAGYVTKDGVKEESPQTIIARVEVTLAWGALTGGPEDNKGSRIEYDVLVEEASSASPRIVAWGPAGTGPSLKTFGNAVTGVRLGDDANAKVPGSDTNNPTDGAQQGEGSTTPAEPATPAAPEGPGEGTNHGEG